MSLGSLMGAVPEEAASAALEESGLSTIRQRKLPLELMIYYVISMALYSDVSQMEVLRKLMEGSSALKLGLSAEPLKCRGGIVKARERLGADVMRSLFENLRAPRTSFRTKGARYKNWRLAAVDGSTLDLPDTAANRAHFGSPGASGGKAAFPQLRFAALVEVGAHIIFGAEYGPCGESESTLAQKLLRKLEPGMLLLADRGFGGHPFFSAAAQTGADLLVRIKNNMILPCHERLPDGSCLSKLHPAAEPRRDADAPGGIPVRVIRYNLADSDGENFGEDCALITTILDPARAPAAELAALYHERWEIEETYGEFKTRLKLPGARLRSKTPMLVEQEFYGFLLAHGAVRLLMRQAARRETCDPDELSFKTAVSIITRKLTAARFPPEPAGTEEIPR